MVPTPRRFRLASQAWGTYSGRPLTPRSRPACGSPELGGEHDLVAVAAQGPAEQVLVLAPAVRVRGSRKFTPRSRARWTTAMTPPRRPCHRRWTWTCSRGRRRTPPASSCRVCVAPRVLLGDRQSWLGYGDRFYPKTEVPATRAARRDPAPRHRPRDRRRDLGHVARLLRQPLLLGYIAGGILLSPQMGFGLVTNAREHRADLGDRPDPPALHHRARDRPAGAHGAWAAPCWPWASASS